MANPLGNFVQKYVLKNLPFKVVSLAIATMLWWAVGRDKPIEIPVTVPLEFQHAPANMDINSDYPLQTRVTLRGPEGLLQGLNPSEVHAVLDVGGASPGQRTFDLTANDIKVPRNVNVEQIVPSQFHLNFDVNATRTVPVQPRVIGTLVTGYSIAGVSTNPANITIMGPQRRLDSIDSAMTDPVDATGVVGTATFTTHAYVSDPLVRVQTPEPIRVTVNTEKHSGRMSQP